MLKSNAIGTFLGGVFLILALGTATLVFSYVHSLRIYLSTQGLAGVATRNQALLQNLLNESVAQRERIPEIVPLLQSLGGRPAAAPAQPPPKRPAK